MAETIPGADAMKDSYASGTQTLQHFASEMQRLSTEAMEQTSSLMEQLRNAKSMPEVMSIQTTFLQRSFSTYAEYTRRFSELMMTLPMEMARHGQSVFQQGSERMTQAAQRFGDEAQQAGDAMKQG